ncbi:hypothetical protein V8C40DRAFT_233559 [Trichoderma camerunense]
MFVVSLFVVSSYIKALPSTCTVGHQVLQHAYIFGPDVTYRDRERPMHPGISCTVADEWKMQGQKENDIHTIHSL